MFNKQQQFFPTPKHIVEKMLQPYMIEKMGRSFLRIPQPILDPSAGKGDLLDGCGQNAYAIEIDPELRMILNEKKYKVIGSDFLQFSDPLTFGFIIMNPPFNEGAKHITHAWGFLADGGELVALCNSETINNPCDRYRQLLVALIDQYGCVEDLGKCFADAERTTDVNVSLIRLSKPKVEAQNFASAGQYQQDTINDTEFSANPLANANYLESLVAQYKMAESLILQRQELNKQIDFYLKGSSGDREDKLNYTFGLTEQIDWLKTRFWEMVFKKANIGSVLTGKFKEDFDKYRSQQKNMAFSVDNIQEMLLMFFGNYNEIMSQCLLEVFDKLTAYCEENKVHHEGWKTNKGYKLNYKIIHPYGVCFTSYGSIDCYRQETLLNDLDKVLCWLSGTKFADIPQGKSTYNALRDHCNAASYRKIDYKNKFESHFFEMRIFKKGTLHLVFKDKELLNEFNKRAAIGKNWMGGKGY